MSHEVGLDDEFYVRLEALDAELVRATQARGCDHCDGRLDRADFPRKPRGLPPAAEPLFGTRYALCCSREGCRRRALPPSVRFLGRFVYAAVVVVAACLAEVARRSWQEARRIARWLVWWRQVFGRSSGLRALRGQLALPVASAALPASLLERLGPDDETERMVAFLVLIAPVVGRLGHER